MLISRFVMLWFFMLAPILGVIFGWRYISKNDVAVTGKLIAGGIISFVFAMFIFLMET